MKAILQSDWPAASASAQEVLQWALGAFQPNIAIAASFSLENVTVIDLAVRVQPKVRVFAIDTGRLPEETYEVAEAVRQRFGVRIEWVFPRREAVEQLEREQGLYSFRESIEARHACCNIRKVEPLSRALVGLQAWITGMRREQGVTRESLCPVQADPVHGNIVKVNPLFNWTTADVEAYVKKHSLPVNRLYQEGYTSIGCAPCTRAVEPGDHPRAGRWWWEAPEHKECGIHVRRHVPNYKGSGI
ncbi:MAG: phosphoadenylyl-sulfate reductase [Kiritimatiellia bacterium]